MSKPFRHSTEMVKEIPNMLKPPFIHRVDNDEDPLPHGGATDIFGRVVWALTEEEEEAMVRKIQSAFGG